MRLSTGLLIAATLALSSCSPKGELETAQKATEHFHDQYNAGQYAAIYSAVDEDFRSTAKVPEFVSYETGVRAKLGDFKSAEMMNYNVLYLFGKVEVRLDYDSKFAGGKAVETFQVKVKNGKAEISGYRIDSPVLPNQPK